VGTVTVEAMGAMGAMGGIFNEENNPWNSLILKGESNRSGGPVGISLPASVIDLARLPTFLTGFILVATE